MKTPESRVTAGRISSAVLFRFRFHAEKKGFSEGLTKSLIKIFSNLGSAGMDSLRFSLIGDKSHFYKSGGHFRTV